MTRKQSSDREAAGGARQPDTAESHGDAHRLMVVLCTAGDDTSAQALARTLVEERLAACVSRAPVQSTYRWKEAVVSDGEVLLVIKTATSLWPRVQQRIRELHSYECPEIVAVTAADVDADYMAWLLAACGVVV